MNTIAEFEQEHNVRLVPKAESWLMRVAGWVLKPFTPEFMTYFWTTFRIPFQKPTISYPLSTKNPLKHMEVLDHELVHAEDMRSSWGLFKMFWLVWLLPLPILFSGRWFIERKAYLLNILKHNRNIDEVVDSLWNNYGWAWPKSLMKKWFEEKVKEHKE